MLAALLLIRSVSVPGTQLEVKLATQVGAPYDAAAVARDVKTLWSTGRFRDVRAEVRSSEDGADVVFRAEPEPQYPLREIRYRPHAFGLQIALPAGTLLSQPRARELAVLARRQLYKQGYVNAGVTPVLEPLPNGKADLVLQIQPGDAIRLKPTGDTSLRAPRWYSREAVDSHAARLRANWIAKGYFDVRVQPIESIEGKHANVEFHVDPGSFYHELDWKTICGCLLRERRTSERQGILDLHASVDEDGIWAIERGRPYTIGRIRFFGHPHYSDALIRRHLLVDEGELLDSWRLRLSVVRLNRSGIFEPLDERHVHIATDERTGVADVTIQLTERKRGAWNFSGPLPLNGSIRSRLPAWGAGILEASTYTLGFNVVAYSTILKLASNRTWMPILSLDRPFTPGGGWLSGFLFAPQLGPRWMLLHYAGSQLEGRLAPLLAGTRAPDLEVTFQRKSGESAPLLCESPKPRMRFARAAATLTLGLARTLTN